MATVPDLTGPENEPRPLVPITVCLTTKLPGRWMQEIEHLHRLNILHEMRVIGGGTVLTGVVTRVVVAIVVVVVVVGASVVLR